MPPRISNPVARGLASIGATLGRTVAKSAIKKKKKSRRSNRSRIDSIMPFSSPATSSAPVTIGTTVRMKSTTPFNVPFTAIAFQLSTTAANNAVFTSLNGAANQNGTVCLCFVPSGGTGTFITAFPNQILNIAENFARYRMKKLLVHYRPYVSSATAGAVAFAVLRDPGAEGGTSNAFTTVGSCRGAVTCSVWQPATIDATGLGLVDTSEKYVDVAQGTGDVSNAGQRLDGCCTLAVGGGSASGLLASQTYGYFILEGILEFIDLVNPALL